MHDHFVYLNCGHYPIKFGKGRSKCLNPGCDGFEYDILNRVASGVENRSQKIIKINSQNIQ